MDDLQNKIVKGLSNYKECMDNRSQLKGALSDILIDDKMHINIIMNAYDDEILLKMEESSDKTLTALNFIKQMMANYGISEENARWSVEVWCAVLGYLEISTLLSSIQMAGSSDNANRVHHAKRDLDDSMEYDIGLGVYCAGIDFPDGRVSIVAQWKKGQKDVIHYGIGAKPEKIEPNNGMFTDKTYIEIDEGQYVLFKLNNLGYKNDLLSLKAKKI